MSRNWADGRRKTVFAYDDAGNRLSQATTGAGAGTVAYSYDVRDRLLTEAGQTYGWDANGNLTSKQGGATYTWVLADTTGAGTRAGAGADEASDERL